MASQQLTDIQLQSARWDDDYGWLYEEAPGGNVVQMSLDQYMQLQASYPDKASEHVWQYPMPANAPGFVDRITSVVKHVFPFHRTEDNDLQARVEPALADIADLQSWRRETNQKLNDLRTEFDAYKGLTDQQITDLSNSVTQQTTATNRPPVRQRVRVERVVSQVVGEVPDNPDWSKLIASLVVAFLIALAGGIVARQLMLRLGWDDLFGWRPWIWACVIGSVIFLGVFGALIRAMWPHPQAA